MASSMLSRQLTSRSWQRPRHRVPRTISQREWCSSSKSALLPYPRSSHACDGGPCLWSGAWYIVCESDAPCIVVDQLVKYHKSSSVWRCLGTCMDFIRTRRNWNDRCRFKPSQIFDSAFLAGVQKQCDGKPQPHNLCRQLVSIVKSLGKHCMWAGSIFHRGLVDELPPSTFCVGSSETHLPGWRVMMLGINPRGVHVFQKNPWTHTHTMCTEDIVAVECRWEEWESTVRRPVSRLLLSAILSWHGHQGVSRRTRPVCCQYPSFVRPGCR